MTVYSDLLQVAQLKSNEAQARFAHLKAEDDALKAAISQLRQARSGRGFQQASADVMAWQSHAKWLTWTDQELRRLTQLRLGHKLRLEDARVQAAKAFGKTLALEEVLKGLER
ncbi:hypothetical protein [Nereida sp. MMG025]|uniref:hypothetical protein n=1 Tax=Nereida sp. MMG025 TaxID=2909981 RepID=UPI001F28397C|nr:hypothetical protein [Nereida sp. MMG025]MCF6444676.1 hypothetical protein [Nereida sp. MMG025]